MKRLLLGALLLLSMTTFAQSVFVRKYDWYTQKIDTKQVYTTATVVYNYNDTTDIMVYTNTNTIHLLRVGEILEGSNSAGEKYQQIKCIDKADGHSVIVQLYDADGAVRFIIGNDYIEYHQKL